LIDLLIYPSSPPPPRPGASPRPPIIFCEKIATRK